MHQHRQAQIFYFSDTACVLQSKLVVVALVAAFVTAIIHVHHIFARNLGMHPIINLHPHLCRSLNISVYRRSSLFLGFCTVRLQKILQGTRPWWHLSTDEGERTVHGVLWCIVCLPLEHFVEFLTEFRHALFHVRT
jgi:hypothetical protein